MGAAQRTFETDVVGLALAHDSAALHVQGAADLHRRHARARGLHVVPGYAPEGAHGDGQA